MSQSASTPSVSGVKEKLNDLTARFDAFSNWLENTDDRVSELEDENERLRKELEEVRTTAEQAMTVASRGHNPETASQVEVAKRTTRNALIKRVANGSSGQNRVLNVSEVDTLAGPEYDFAYQTVKDAWGDLTSSWGCFHKTTKDGNKALGIKAGAIKPALVRAVEKDLDRDDLTKSVISGEGAGGI